MRIAVEIKVKITAGNKVLIKLLKCVRVFDFTRSYVT